MPGLSMRLSRSVRARISLHLLVGQRRVGIDERQRHLAIQRGVERLPELQGGRPAVEDQQPVAAAGDAGAGDQVDVFVGGREPRSPVRAARRRAADRGAGRRRSRGGLPDAGRPVPIRAVRRHRRRRRRLRRRHRVIGGDVGLEVVGRRTRDAWSSRLLSARARRRPTGRRSPPVLSVILAPATAAGGPRRIGSRDRDTRRRERIPLIRVRDEATRAWLGSGTRGAAGCGYRSARRPSCGAGRRPARPAPRAPARPT